MKILVPTDFSENAEAGLEFAMRVFDDKENEIRVISAFLTSHHVPHTPVSNDHIIKKQILGRLKEFVKGKQFRGKVKINADYGLTNQVILKYTEDSDIIAMGTHGASDFLGKIMGTHASAIAKDAVCSVLVTPHHYQIRNIKKLLIAIEPNQVIQRHDKVLDYFLKKGITVECVSFIRGRKEADGEMENENSVYKLQYRKVLIKKDLFSELKHYVKTNNYNLVVVFPKEHTFLESIFHKSFTRALILHSEVPVLVIR